MKKYDHKCESCNLVTQIELVTSDVTIAEVLKIGDDGEIDYGDPVTYGGVYSRHQCEHCGFILPVDDEDSVLNYLELQAEAREEEQRRDEKHGLYPDKEDIAN